MSQTLIESLMSPKAYPHPVDRVELHETHISWVFLAGEFAYKVKKPVQFGFLDFSTLERRRFFCDEELRLNGRLAPHLYLRSVPLGPGTAGQPSLVIGGEPAEEYAVQMRRFPQEALLIRLAEESRLTPQIIDVLAAEVAGFHDRIDRAGSDTRFGTPETVLKPVLECFEPAGAGADPEDVARLQSVHRWVEEEHRTRQAVFESRRASGFIRECHGDMHLGNMLLEGDRVTIFDGIEFSESLRWIDVLSEVAFTFMDLIDHGRRDLAQRFLNAYLEHTGDYAGLGVLRFYAVYRALVRAKVAGLRLAQPDLDQTERSKQIELRSSYIELADALTRPNPARILITHGLSGSGKSVGTQSWLEQLPAIRIRSDIERRRQSAADPLRYSPEATSAVYNRLLDLARQIVTDGHAVIVDATFLRREQRQRFQALADEWHVPFTILHFDAPHAVLRQRVAERQKRGGDPSEATVDVLEQQIRTVEPLDDSERPFVETVQ